MRGIEACVGRNKRSALRRFWAHPQANRCSGKPPVIWRNALRLLRPTGSLNALDTPRIKVFPDLHKPCHGVALAHVQLRDAVDVFTILHLM